MDELKPCPFCGGKARYANVDVKWIISYIECEACGCRTAAEIDKNDAKRAWNRRIDHAQE
jgi:Lar family restriction alleviation protein